MLLTIIFIICLVVSIILVCKVEDAFSILLACFTIALIVSLSITTIRTPYAYEFTEPVKYNLTEVEAKKYYESIQQEDKCIKLYKDNNVVKCDVYDVDINTSSTNYVEYYKLCKLKEFRYYFLNWPGKINYFYFHFSEGIK